MLTALSIMILIVELFFIFIYIISSIKHKTILLKNVFASLIIVYLIGLCTYLLGTFYTQNKMNLPILADCILASVKNFIMFLSKNIIGRDVLKNVFYSIAFYLSFFMAVAVLIEAIYCLLRKVLRNKIIVFIRLCKGCDIITYYNEDSLNYAKRNSNTILLNDKRLKKLSKEEKKNLELHNIGYIEKEISIGNIKKLLFNKEYHFIVFSKNQKESYFNYIEVFSKIIYPKSKKEYIYLHLETEENDCDLITKQITESSKECNEKVIISSFNTYELAARKFSLDHNVTEFLPNNYISDGLLDNEKEINVVFLGVGKINYAMFKMLVMNNQFVCKENNTYKAKCLNYYLYDNNELSLNKEVFNRLLSEYYQKDSTSEDIEKICNLQLMKTDSEMLEAIYDVKKLLKPNSFTLIFVGYSNGLQNALLAEKLQLQFKDKKDKLKIFYNIDDEKECLKNANSNITAYGLRGEILNHNIIAKDELSFIARCINSAYDNISMENQIKKWSNLSYIEKYSNIYSAINIRFKLNLMGLDCMNVKTDSKISKEEYYQKYFEVASLSEIENFLQHFTYTDYFKTSMRNTLIYQEHLRWVAYYFINGFDKMMMDDMRFENGKYINKNIEEKKHCCMVSFLGLDKYHKTLLALYNKQGLKKDINDVETYKYDCMVCDNLYDILEKGAYSIVKINQK